MGCMNSCIFHYILVIDEDENSCELVVIRGFFMLKKKIFSHMLYEFCIVCEA